MAVCVQDLDSAMLYAFWQLWGLKKKAFMKHLSWLLMGYGKFDLCYEVIELHL